MTQSDLYEFLCGCKLGVLGTLGPAGPQSALVGVAVTEQLEIIFDTVKSSRKYGNLIASPKCSFVIGWTGERSAQCEGEALGLSGDDFERYRKVYFQAWPDRPSRLLLT
ncbi:MAG: pyridoxamine 5'-phosphate oxidase family protein [Steroidobacteraceae bacterium]